MGHNLKGRAHSIVKGGTDQTDRLGGGRGTVGPGSIGQQGDRDVCMEVDPEGAAAITEVAD
jgi:hypothetical protein